MLILKDYLRFNYLTLPPRSYLSHVVWPLEFYLEYLDLRNAVRTHQSLSLLLLATDDTSHPFVMIHIAISSSLTWRNRYILGIFDQGNDLSEWEREREYANRFKVNCSSNKFRFQRRPALQLTFHSRMVIIELIIVLGVLSGQVFCDVDAKVEVIKESSTTARSNTTITPIQYTNNGKFKPEFNVTSVHRIATYGPQMIGQCGGIFRNTQVLIEAPKFISAHPICNLRCEYQIVSPYICENEFHVQFLEFSIDSSVECERDKIVINHSDVLCGKLLGTKTYRSTEGVLNVTFVSNSWDSTGKGFKLLITRQPCVDVKENQFEVDSLEPSLGMPAASDNDTNCLHHVNASISVADPTYENGHPVYGVPAVEYNVTSSRQDIPVVPLPTPPPPYPFPFPTTQSPIYPPFPPFPFPPRQCCRNVYNQQRFMMFSQGFPAYVVLHNDCTFVLHKSSLNACRLRINFKYFFLDDQAPVGQLGCLNNFIEIDGQRICGCKTNFVYETQWGLEPKVIRLRTTPGQYLSPQGFIFDVEQLDCPFKIQQAPDENGEGNSLRVRRTLFAGKFLLAKKHIFTPRLSHAHGDIEEGFHAKFFPSPNTNPNGYINNVCTLNHLRLMQLKLESFGILKHYCLPAYWIFMWVHCRIRRRSENKNGNFLWIKLCCMSGMFF